MPQLFGPKLLYLRQQQNLSQAELSRLLGTSRAHINNIEAGRKLPSLAFISRAARLFSVSADYLARDGVAIEAIHNEPTISEGSLLSLPFGERLKTLRLNKGWTQAELAQQLGLRTHSHISFLESGRKAPSLELLIQLADALHVSVDLLIHNSSDESTIYPSL